MNESKYRVDTVFLSKSSKVIESVNMRKDGVGSGGHVQSCIPGARPPASCRDSEGQPFLLSDPRRSPVPPRSMSPVGEGLTWAE